MDRQTSTQKGFYAFQHVDRHIYRQTASLVDNMQTDSHVDKYVDRQKCKKVDRQNVDGQMGNHTDSSDGKFESF